MGDFAEFGPLDVQVADNEEIGKYKSGLNIFTALEYLEEEVCSFFIENLLKSRKMGLSTKNAIKISSNLTNIAFTPILSQINPINMGQLYRAVKIALKYGNELIYDGNGNIEGRKLWDLVMNYPDHEYIIDLKQAKTIFKSVRDANELEQEIGLKLHTKIRYPEGQLIVEKLNKENRNEKFQSGIPEGISKKKITADAAK